LLHAAALLLCMGASGQGFRLDGTVTENDGKTAVAGARIAVKGTSAATTTDAKGSFVMTVRTGDVLEVSCMGYSTQDVKVGSATTMSIKLVADEQQIDNVVVTALGMKREEKSLGYAVSKVTGEQLTTVVANNWLSGLDGKVAGLNLESASSGPSGSTRVTLRGENSLNPDNNQALFVIDGVPVGSRTQNFGGSAYSTDAPVDMGNGVGDLNPDDIESVSVLKGPAATALYGSRAGAGAIIITTKSGKGRTGLGITLNSAVTLERAGFWPDFQDEYGAGNANLAGIASDPGDARRYYSFWTIQANQTDNGQRVGRLQSRYAFGPRYEGQMFYTYNSRNFDDDTYTRMPWVAQDWYKGFFRTGVTYTNSVSMDGSMGRDGSFRLSFKDTRNEWIAPNTGYASQNINLAASQQINRRIKLDARATYYRKNSDNLPTTGYSNSSPLYTLMWNVTSIPIKSYYDEWASGRIHEMLRLDQVNNTTSESQKLITNGLSENVYRIVYENLNSLDRDRVYGNVSATAGILPDLNLMVRTGVDFNSDFATQRRPLYSSGYADGYYREQSTTSFQMNNDFLLTWKRDLPGELNLYAGFGGNNMVSNYRYVNVVASKLFSNVFTMQNSMDNPLVTPTRSNKSINSLYGFANFAWRDTYFVEITGRNDWSSTLPRSNNSYFYPSVSASVLLDKAIGLRRYAPWVDMLRLRGSWANVGNDTDPYRTALYYSNSNFSSSYTLPRTLQNPLLKPENVESWEAGLEAKLFNNRWSLDLVLYRAKTTNQIIPSPVDDITGTGNLIINAGDVRNRGIELATTVWPVKTRNIGWSVSLNWSLNRNKLVALAPGVEKWSVNPNTIGSRVFIDAYPGTELGRIYGYGYQRAPRGAFYMDANGNRVDCEGAVVVDPVSGKPLLKNSSADDLIDLGSIFPDWKGGFGSSLRLWDFNVDMTFAGQWGGNCYSVSHFALSYQGKLKNTLPGRYDGLVHPGVNLNPDGTYQKNATITTDIVDYYSSTVYERSNAEMNTFDTSYLKFKELRIGYNLPASICKKTGVLQAANIGFYATNLFCWTNFPFYDPEAAAINGSSISRGIEIGAYPMTRTYGMNIKLSF
jgi:TonB-linked SusC/RagA family outer membrane protein